MNALDVANQLLHAHGTTIPLTNLRLNKLVFFTQVESLRRTQHPCFLDDIEAWECGPMIPAVYDSFDQYGSNQIAVETYVPALTEQEQTLIADIAKRYGRLSVYDLVRLSHRRGGAWQRVYSPRDHAVIAPDVLLESADMGEDSLDSTFSAQLDRVNAQWSNTITLLERA